jgi:hypothetical protein
MHRRRPQNILKYINMKTSVLFISFFLLILAGCKKSNSTNVNLNNGLVAYFPFNGNAKDAGPNHLDGITQPGVTFTADISGKANSAVSFDGVRGFISVKDSLGQLSPDVVSISFLANLSDVVNREALINKVNYDDATGLSYGISLSANSPDEKFDFASIPSSFGCSSTAYDIPNVTINSGETIIPNHWYHVAAIFSDSVQKIYINGVLRTAITRNYSVLNKCAGTTLLIGGWWKNDIISVKGSMDEVRIYNRELNQDEINELAKPVK